MKTMKTLILIFVLLFSTSVFSENIKDKNEKESSKQLTGKVTDRLTGENLAGVKIEILDGNFVVYSDFDGNFELPIAYKDSEISVSYISYEKEIIETAKLLTGYCDIKLLPVTR